MTSACDDISPVEEDSEPVIGQDDFHDQGGAHAVNLLEVVIAVEQRQAADEGHHHQLHQAPGRGLGARAGAHRGLVTRVLPVLLTMFAPDSEDADEEGEGGHDDLPGLGGAELSVAPEHLPEARGEHRDQA